MNNDLHDKLTMHFTFSSLIIQWQITLSFNDGANQRREIVSILSKAVLSSLFQKAYIIQDFFRVNGELAKKEIYIKISLQIGYFQTSV